MSKWAVIENLAILIAIVALAVFAHTLWGLILILALNSPKSTNNNSDKEK